MSFELVQEVVIHPLTSLVVGSALAIFLYFKALPQPKISYELTETSIVGGKNPAFEQDIEIRFKGHAVDRVTITNLMIWNSGNTTVDGNQILPQDPLRFDVGQPNKILRAEITGETRKINGAKVVVTTENSLAIKFDYLDRNDGLNIEITHSCAPGLIRPIGTIKGIPSGLQRSSEDNIIDKIFIKYFKNPSFAKRLSESLIVMILVTTYMAAITLSSDIYPTLPNAKKQIQPTVFYVTIGMGLFYFLVVVMPLLMRFSKRPPAKLNVNHRSS